MTKIVALSGSLSRPSRTRHLVETIAQRLAHQLDETHSGAQIAIIDMADLAEDLGRAISFNNIPTTILEAHQQLAEADVIVLGSPIYKASYTGLLKHFLDLLDPSRLRNKVVILAASGGSDRHALVLEHQFRPLASFFETITVPAGVYVRDSEFVNYTLSESEQTAATFKRIDLAIQQTQSLLTTLRPSKINVALAA